MIVGILKWRHSSCSGRQSFDSNASSTKSSFTKLFHQHLFVLLFNVFDSALILLQLVARLQLKSYVFVMKIFGPISQRFCLFEIPPQFSLSVWFFLLSIVKVWHLQMMMIIFFSKYDLMEKAKNLERRSRVPISSRILLQQLNWNRTRNRFWKFWLFVCW